MTPKPSEGPQKRSLEGLNSEIQKLVLTDAQTERVSFLYVVRSWRDFFMLYCYEKLLFWGCNTRNKYPNTINGWVEVEPFEYNVIGNYLIFFPFTVCV